MFTVHPPPPKYSNSHFKPIVTLYMVDKVVFIEENEIVDVSVDSRKTWEPKQEMPKWLRTALPTQTLSFYSFFLFLVLIALGKINTHAFSKETRQANTEWHAEAKRGLWIANPKLPTYIGENVFFMPFPLLGWPPSPFSPSEAVLTFSIISSNSKANSRAMFFAMFPILFYVPMGPVWTSINT